MEMFAVMCKNYLNSFIRWFDNCIISLTYSRFLGGSEHGMDLDKAVGTCSRDHPIVLLAHQPRAAKEALDSDFNIKLVLSGIFLFHPSLNHFSSVLTCSDTTIMALCDFVRPHPRRPVSADHVRRVYHQSIFCRTLPIQERPGIRLAGHLLLRHSDESVHSCRNNIYFSEKCAVKLTMFQTFLGKSARFCV